MSANAPIDQLRAVTEANLDDALRAFVSHDSPLRPLLKPFLYVAARRLAHDVIACDRRVGEVGVQRALFEALMKIAGGLEPSGLPHLPNRGPLLVTANHPGLTDTLALIGTIPRPDLRIVTRDNPLLRGMLELSPALIYLPDDPNKQHGALRQIVRHLKAGGAILLFPAGKIEPDPALYPDDALAGLATWSHAPRSLAKLVPDLVVVPSVVSGTVHPVAATHPLTYLRRPEHRPWLVATLQMLMTRYQDNIVRLVYGAPLRAAEVLAESVEARTEALMTEIISTAAEAAPLPSNRELVSPSPLREVG